MKQAPNDEIYQFTQWVLNFINPKFNSEAEMVATESVLYEFAKESNLTALEMQEAIKKTAKSELYLDYGNGNIETIRLFREIDRLKLHEIERAYILFRDENIAFKNGLKSLEEELKKLTLPPSTLSQAEKNAQKDAEIWKFVSDLKAKKEVPTLCLWIYHFLDRMCVIKPFIVNLSPTEKEKMREEVAKELLIRAKKAPKKHEKEYYKKALLDFRNKQNEEEEPIKSVKKEIAVKWWIVGSTDTQ